MTKSVDEEKDKLNQLQKSNKDLILKMKCCMTRLKKISFPKHLATSKIHIDNQNDNPSKTPRKLHSTIISPFQSPKCRYISKTPILSSIRISADKNSDSKYLVSTPKSFSCQNKMRSFKTNLESVGNSRKRNEKQSSSLNDELKTPVISTIPKSILQSSTNAAKSLKKINKVCFAMSSEKKLSKKNKMKSLDCSMLGYDWIAGMLDNDSYVNDKSDEFFEEILKFRRMNSEECTSDAFFFSDSPENILIPTPNIKKNETCSCYAGTSYMVNNRLNFIPVQTSLCENVTNHSVSNFENNFVRVTIPKSACETTYKVKSHRRKSFDPNDSVALSMHCLAGWQNSKPSFAPGPKNIDLASHTLPLTSRLKSKTR